MGPLRVLDLVLWNCLEFGILYFEFLITA